MERLEYKQWELDVRVYSRKKSKKKKKRVDNKEKKLLYPRAWQKKVYGEINWGHK